jgi:hypothetical protein
MPEALSVIPALQNKPTKGMRVIGQNILTTLKGQMTVFNRTEQVSFLLQNLFSHRQEGG